VATLVIARLTFREAARRKILIAALVLGLVFLAVYGVGFYFIDSEMQRSIGTAGFLEKGQIRNFLFMAGMYVVNFLTVMMAVLTSVDTLSGEIASGTIHTMIAKPIHRREVVLGKWLGFLGMLTLYMLLMAGGISLLIYLISGYTAPNLVRGITLLWMNGILLLSVSLLGGTMLSTLANGVLVFGLFGIAFVGGWIEQIGSFISNQTAINVGIISSLIIPSEALWKRAAFEMQSPLVQALGFSPFSSSSVPSLIMVGYAILYTVIALGLAINRFQHRDL
jgi:ABC-type transport system involved in multi-copper enzyme maturation permease subunit